VTNYDIAEALKAQGHEVTKAMVRLPQGPLKQVGDVHVTLDLHGDVTATITVSVLGEASN
jgi:large subunit ribosomal protein L9